jgi:hypothetical protein
MLSMSLVAFLTYRSNQYLLSHSQSFNYDCLPEDYDPNKWITSNKFQPTIAGYYIVQASVWWDAGSVTNNQNNIQFRKNGTTQVVINQTQVLTGSGYAQELNTITYFNGTTDYIELTAFTGNTTSQGINGAASGTWLEIALITVGVGSQGQQGPTGPAGTGGGGGTTASNVAGNLFLFYNY